MENDELNKYIHQTVLGKCWHEYRGDCVCQKPGCSADNAFYNIPPDYCNSLDAIREAELKAASTVGWPVYEHALCMEFLKGDRAGFVHLSDALTRAKAIREVWGGE